MSKNRFCVLPATVLTTTTYLVVKPQIVLVAKSPDTLPLPHTDNTPQQVCFVYMASSGIESHPEMLYHELRYHFRLLPVLRKTCIAMDTQAECGTFHTCSQFNLPFCCQGNKNIPITCQFEASTAQLCSCLEANYKSEINWMSRSLHSQAPMCHLLAGKIVQLYTLICIVI